MLTTQTQDDDIVANYPRAPKSIEEAGLNKSFLINLLLKFMYQSGYETEADLVNVLKLPLHIVSSLFEEVRHRELVEGLGVLRPSDYSGIRYRLTSKGRDWAVDALSQSRYVGPAPVILDDYRAQIERQSITHERIGDEQLSSALRDLIIPDELRMELGAAVNSGKSLLIYGPSGNGKTSIAEAIGNALRSTIFVPYSVIVGGEVVVIYDEGIHQPPIEQGTWNPQRDNLNIPTDLRDFDQRWVACRRPVVLTGGELTLQMLDLIFTDSLFYEAPLHVKAMNGVFIIDDFGRQFVSPNDLLNRWIVPLERHIDFLTLRTGKKFSLPFDEFVVFATNIAPRELMDPAQLRRIPFKMEIEPPTYENYERVFRGVCEKYNLKMPENLIAHLKTTYYEKDGKQIAYYHPKFIVEHVLAYCRYREQEPVLNEETLKSALPHLDTSY